MLHMSKFGLTSLAFIVLCLCSAIAAKGDSIIFDNGPPLGTAAFNIGGSVYTADDFSFSSSQTINNVRFWARANAS